MDKSFSNPFQYKLIYIFQIKDDTHKGLLKIGDASITAKSIQGLTPNCKALNDAAKERIKSYTNTAAISVDLLHTELAVRYEYAEDGSTIIKSFRDYNVHRVLENSNIKKKKIKGSTSKEWFEVDLSTAIKAIDAVKNGYFNLSNEKIDDYIPIVFRPEQEDAIAKTLKQFKSGNKMLWNAKMRFGKTLCALEVIRKSNFKKTIILTHRPVVDNSWYGDFTKIFANTTQYIYGSKNTGYTIDDLLKIQNEDNNKHFIYFASIQDLRGSIDVGGKHDKNSIIFSLDWDFVIVDEAHEGTTTSLGNDVIKKIVKEDTNYDTKFLALSGTPFNILGDYEDNIYTWDYIMEQSCKRSWDELNFGDSNPYDDLPELNIFTYNLGDILNTKRYNDLGDKAFNFKEFFRVWTGDIKKDKKPLPSNKKIGDFYHERDVLSFLNLITKEDKHSHYPYSTEEYRNLFKHSLLIVPGVKEAKALSALMKKHHVFGCGMFNIVNVAGDGDEEERTDDALRKVREAIDNAGEDYTITLSCGKLTTGVTVPEWTAVFMLSGSFSTSAANYLQTIFRVQSPCNKNGQVKTSCYVFDFAPDRTLKMVAESVAISTKAGKTTSSDKTIMGEFLNYCPVISIDGTNMLKYDVNKLLQQLKRAYAERAVSNGFDDKNLYNDELLKINNIDIEKFNNLKKIVGSSKAMPKVKEIDINNQGFTDEEYEKGEKLAKKPKKERTPEEEELLKKINEQKKLKAAAISILRSISIRIPLLIYGADVDINDDITFDKLVDIVDESSWNEFMPQGVTKELFLDFAKYYDTEVFIAAGRKIRNIVKEADLLPPNERISKIANLFACFKNPDKETVLTPWRVVNAHMSDCLGGYSFYDEDAVTLIDAPRFVNHDGVTANTLGNKDATILEINSKTGLYPLYVAYSIYCSKCRYYEGLGVDYSCEDLWEETIKNNIFILTKTKMAKLITQRTLVGFKKIQVNSHYFDNLINMLDNKPAQLIEKIHKPAYWKKKGIDKMKFDAIVGNPPYQKMDGGAQSSATPLYHKFVDLAKKLNPQYISMIIPSRWFAGGKGLDEFRLDMLNDTRLKTLHDYIDATDCFPGVDIKGGVCYFLWDNTYNDICNIFTHEDSKTISESKRYLLETHSDVFIRHNDAIPILKKVLSNTDTSFSTIVSSRKPFGLGTSFLDFKEKKNGEHSIKIFANKKTGYVDEEQIPKNKNWINQWKVIIPKAVGSANMKSDWVNPILLEPGTVCTETYLVLGPFQSKIEAENVISYTQTKFFHFLLGLRKVTQDTTQKVYKFIPMQDFSESWSDEKLYKKYNLTDKEINFIESMVKPTKLKE